jgi:hypothetical protein
VESVCVSVPALAVAVGVAAVGDVVVGDVVVGDVVAGDAVVGDVESVGEVVDGVPAAVVEAAGVVVTATPPRFTAPPHVAAVPVFVTRTSVTTSVTPAGTVKTSTEVVPEGTARVISTMFCTVALAAAVGTPVTV